MMVHVTGLSGDIQLGSLFERTHAASRVVHDEPLLFHGHAGSTFQENT